MSTFHPSFFIAEPINSIAEVPRLYISEYSSLCPNNITVPQSTTLLQKHNITHVLSLTDQRNRPICTPDLDIRQIHIDIEDNPFEDVVMVLEGACAWIDDALEKDGTVLVHCIQGVSRSGSIVIAYLMRSLEIGFDAALGLARKSRVAIGPNSGFVEQLRLWGSMGYTIYGDDEGQVKPQYENWKANRGLLLSKGEQMKQEVMMRSMADMAARFGRRKLELKKKQGVGKSVIDDLSSRGDQKCTQ
ncbi:hypothetical protein N0V90_006213 [Kalmusia sp. IMI 367209]|nr:hypothetical protein N0V90_006213 [Kalmusia sp. IMI 367209]